jgi:hypothetical protein
VPQRIVSYLRRNHLAVLALFIALGGTSYAAVKLPANSVGAKQLKKSAVSSSKVKDGSLRTADLSTAARAALRGQKGDAGPAGAAGPRGDAGSAGPTASATTSQATTVALTTTDAEVMHTDVTTTFSSTLVAHATADVVRTSGGSGNIHCKLQIAPGPAFTAYTAVGQLVEAYEPGTNTFEDTLPLLGATSRPAGAYRFRTQCGMGAGAGAFIAGDMAVVATG